MVLIILSEVSNLDNNKTVRNRSKREREFLLFLGLENAALACSLLHLLPGSQNLDASRRFQYYTLFTVFQKLLGNSVLRKRRQNRIKHVKAIPFH